MEIQRQRTYIQKQVQIAKKITINKTKECTETRCMRQAQAVAEQHRGTAITLTFLTRAGLSSVAGAFTIMVLMLACSISIAAMAMATAIGRSVRSWSHFNVTLDLDLCKSAQILNYLSTQITGSNLKMEYSYKKVLRSKTFFGTILKG